MSSALIGAVRDLVVFEYLSGWRQGSVKKLEWADVDMATHTARLRSENSKNKTTWILPLTREAIGSHPAPQKSDTAGLSVRVSPEWKADKGLSGLWATACNNSGLVASRAGGRALHSQKPISRRSARPNSHEDHRQQGHFNVPAL